MTEKKKPEFPKCAYNIGVQCFPERRKCENCGWNPKVEKCRNEKMNRKG